MIRRLVLTLGWLPACLAGLFALALLFVMTTETGLSSVWSVARDRLPEGIEVESVSGRLIGPLEVRGVDIDLPALSLCADRLVLDWRPSRLAVAKVQIATVGGEGIQVVLRPDAAPSPEEPDSPLSLDFRAPITLVIEHAFIRDLRVQPAPEAEPLILDSLSLAGVWDRGSVELSEFTLRSPLSGPLEARLFALLEHNAIRIQTLHLSSPDSDLETRLSGHVRQTLGRLNLDLQGQWTALRWPLTGEAQMRSPSGRFALTGTLPALQAELDARLLSRNQPANIQARALLKQDQVDARLQWDSLAWPLETSAGDVQLRLQSGELNAKGPLEAVRLRGQTAVLPTNFQPVEIRLQGTANPQSVRLEPLRLDVAGSETRLTGRVTWQPDLTARLTLASRGVDPSALSGQLADWPGQIAANGEFQLRIEEEQLRIHVPSLRADGQLRDQDLVLALQGAMSPQSIAVDQFTLEALGGELAGALGVTLQPRLDGQATLTLRDLDPAVLLPQWPGALQGNVRVKLAGTQASPDISLPELSLSGTLRDRDIALNSQLQYRDKNLSIQSLELSSGASELAIAGRASPADMDLQWQISSPDLADFYPGLTGRLTGDGQLRGPATTPRLTADLRGESLGYQRYAVAGVDLAADLDFAEGSVFNLDVRLADAQVATTGIRTLVLEASGGAEALDIHLATQTTEGSVTLDLSGALDVQAPAWTGELTQLRLQPVDFPPWVLEAEAGLELRQNSWSVDGLCLAAEAGRFRSEGTSGGPSAPRTVRRSRLCVQGAADAGGLSVQTDIDYFDLAYLTPLLPPATRLSGSLRGEAGYERQGGRERLSADLQTSAIELMGTRTPDDPLEIAFAPGLLSASEEQDGTQVQLSLPLEDDESAGLKLDARLAGQGLIVDRALDGRLTAELSNLDFVALLVDALTDVTGQLRADMRLSGQVKAPQVDGQLQLAEAAASIDAAGIDLRDVEVTVSGDPTASLQLKARARSGDGELQATATAQLGEQQRVEARVSGERFLAYNTDDARVVVTPDLQFRLDGRQATLEGAVRVPSADITPQKRDSESLVRASDDEVIIGPRARDQAAEPILMSATVDLVLGEEVHFEGFGLRSRIEGQITARDRPGNQTTATGELRLVDGAYKAYGQNLDIRRGRLIFAGGPIAEPGLDVKASRYPTEDIEVGVRVRGPLNRPEFELYSDPSMDQQEQLSYLVLGRSLDRRSGASGTEQAALANAALALGLKGGGFLADTLQDKVGLDEISIGAQAGESNDQASLVLGKYLSPKLYISYGVALFKPGQSFRLRYSLSDKWTLKTETGSQTGGDLIYTIERD